MMQRSNLYVANIKYQNFVWILEETLSAGQAACAGAGCRVQVQV